MLRFAQHDIPLSAHPEPVEGHEREFPSARIVRQAHHEREETALLPTEQDELSAFVLGSAA
ncbi:MAG: hypothetical protein HW388_14 [Dehalococcoidia bacterium]|nr:hypothetical protein [Dehalococcoidia bacterium]